MTRSPATAARRTPFALAPLALAPLLIVGCGGGGSDEEPSDDAGAVPVAVGTDRDGATGPTTNAALDPSSGADAGPVTGYERFYGDVRFALRFSTSAETFAVDTRFGPEGRVTTDDGDRLLVATDPGDWASLVCAALEDTANDFLCIGFFSDDSSVLMGVAVGATGTGAGAFEYCPVDAADCVNGLLFDPDGSVAVTRDAPANAAHVTSDVAVWMRGLAQAHVPAPGTRGRATDPRVAEIAAVLCESAGVCR